MKCDELKAETIVPQGCTLTLQMYPKGEVDAYIAELKAENERLKKRMDDYHLMSDIRRAKIKELKRALWMARADRANAEWGHWATIWFCSTDICLNINKSSVVQSPYRCTIKHNAAIWRNIWQEVESKCRAKEDEYK